MRHRLLISVFSLLAASACLCLAFMNRAGDVNDGGLARYKVSAKQEIRHDLSAYTQGLFFYEGRMFESTGQYGESSFREVDPATGKVLRQEILPAEYFGEGSCAFDGRAYILTWYEGLCLVYDIETFTKLAELPYQGQGWGNGTSVLSFRDPVTFMERRTLEVKDGVRPVPYLNELEYIDGEIWANVYGQDFIVTIDPVSGQLTGRIDCTGLLDARYRTSSTDVLNGIAFNPDDGSVYLTGKYWPWMYKVDIASVGE